jgi:hypothetical protein
MTTIVLTHPGEHFPRFQVFAVYEAPNVHHAFALHEVSSRDEAEQCARQMMEDFEADHFRRVVEIGHALGSARKGRDRK